VYAADPPAPAMPEPSLAITTPPTEHVIKVEIGFEPWPLEEAPPSPIAPTLPEPAPAFTATVTPPVMVPTGMPAVIPDSVPPTPMAPSRPTVPEGSKPAPLTLQTLERMALGRLTQVAPIQTTAGRERLTLTGGELPEAPIMSNGFVDLVVPASAQSTTTGPKTAPMMTPAQVEKLTLQYRLVNNVRLRYYHLLALQRFITVREELATMTTEAVAAIEAMTAAGRATKAELLQAKIEAREQVAALQAAKTVQLAVWQRMATTIGQPDMPLGTVAGDLDQSCAMPGMDAAWAHLLEASPELHVARCQVALRQGGVRQTLAATEGKKSTSDKQGDGMLAQAFAKVGTSFTNTDEQVKQSAWTDLARWEAEVSRVEGSLRQRLGEAFSRYNQAKTVAEVYRSQNVPDAKEAYELSVIAYRKGQGSWPQVQIAQRNYFRMATEHVEALAELRRSELTILGLLLDMPEEPTAQSQIKQTGMR
jgi:cobalt-zinc-cadmium efflux system outer membrane protein